MCPGAWSAWLSKHTALSEAPKKLLLFLKAGREPNGQTSQERAAHSSPPSRRKAHYISLCTFIKKKKKEDKKNEEKGNRRGVTSFLLHEQNPGLGSAAIFSCCVLKFLITEKAVRQKQLASLTSLTPFHHRHSRMLCKRQETGDVPRMRSSPLVQSNASRHH